MKSTIKQRSASYSASLSILGGRIGSSIFLLISGFLLLVTFISPNILSGARVNVSEVFAPALSFVSRPFQNMADAVSGISGKAALKAENAKLQSENQRLREWYQTALMLQAENQSLQKLLNLKVPSEQKYVTARVISDSSNSFVKTLLVNSGYDDGVRKNQAALSGDGMIGRIIESGNNASRILLLTDINSRIPVIVEGTNQKAVLAGMNNNPPELRHLPKDSGINIGTRIITSGDGGVFPYGLPIGTVSKSEGGNYLIKPFANMDRITFVRVVDASLNPNLIKGELSSF